MLDKHFQLVFTKLFLRVQVNILAQKKVFEETDKFKQPDSDIRKYRKGSMHPNRQKRYSKEYKKFYKRWDNVELPRQRLRMIETRVLIFPIVSSHLNSAK